MGKVVGSSPISPTKFIECKGWCPDPDRDNDGSNPSFWRIVGSNPTALYQI